MHQFVPDSQTDSAPRAELSANALLDDYPLRQDSAPREPSEAPLAGSDLAALIRFWCDENCEHEYAKRGAGQYIGNFLTFDDMHALAEHLVALDFGAVQGAESLHLTPLPDVCVCSQYGVEDMCPIHGARSQQEAPPPPEEPPFCVYCGTSEHRTESPAGERCRERIAQSARAGSSSRTTEEPTCQDCGGKVNREDEKGCHCGV